MSRAALRLASRDDAGEDELRVPIAPAVLDFHRDVPDDGLAAVVDALVPIESLGLAPQALERGRT